MITYKDRPALFLGLALSSAGAGIIWWFLYPLYLTHADRYPIYLSGIWLYAVSFLCIGFLFYISWLWYTKKEKISFLRPTGPDILTAFLLSALTSVGNFVLFPLFFGMVVLLELRGTQGIDWSFILLIGSISLISAYIFIKIAATTTRVGTYIVLCCLYLLWTYLCATLLGGISYI